MKDHTNDSGYFFSTDKGKLQESYIHQYLSRESYWAQDIPLEVVRRSIEGSFCFGIYKDAKQVGFARVITDYASFAYLADVFVDPAHRGKGLSKEMMQLIFAEESLQGLRRWMLATLDAHGLYGQFGFTPLREPSRFMEMKPALNYAGK